MRYSSKSWHCIERICNVIKADPEETYLKGREFLRYYRQTCCLPEYAMLAEPDGALLFNRKAFLDEMDAVCSADVATMIILLEDSHIAPSQLRSLVSETAMRLHDVGSSGAVYWEIISHKYLGKFPMKDTEISELMAISESSFYNKHIEACAYFMLTMARTVLPHMRDELEQTEAERMLHPREVIYG